MARCEALRLRVLHRVRGRGHRCGVLRQVGPETSHQPAVRRRHGRALRGLRLRDYSSAAEQLRRARAARAGKACVRMRPRYTSPSGGFSKLTWTP